MNINQKHLNHIDAINLGSYYTPEVIVDLAYSILQKNIKNIKDFSVQSASFLFEKNRTFAIEFDCD